MHLLSKVAFAALLLGSTIATSALAATPDSTGCPPGLHRAESEGSGVGTVNLGAQKAASEGSGVGTVNLGSQKAESEGSGVGSVNLGAQKAESEGSGVGTVKQASALAPCK